MIQGSNFAAEIGMKKLAIIVFICFQTVTSWSSSILDLEIELKQKPWVVNAAFEDQTGFAILDAMLVFGGKYLQLPFLMAKKNKIIFASRSPHFQKVIDEAYSKIFSTPTGLHICKIATLGRTDLMIHQFGVSSNFAADWSKRCQENSPASLQYRPNSPRSFALIFSEDPNTPAEAWTNSYGVTFISILPRDLTENFFIRILAHEMAVKFDKKEAIGSWYKLENLEIGDHKPCEILNIIRNPIIKYAFVSHRAYQIENQVLLELGQAVSQSKLTCSEKIQNEIPGILRLIPLIQPELMIQRALARTQNCGTDPIDWVESINTLDRLGLCNYLIKPEIGENTASPTVGGPRPRTTGGWSDIKSNSVLSQAKTMDYWIKDPNLKDTSSFRSWDQAIQEQIKLNENEERLNKITPKDRVR